MTVTLMIFVYLIGIVTGICTYHLSTDTRPSNLSKKAEEAVKLLLKKKNIKVK